MANSLVALMGEMMEPVMVLMMVAQSDLLRAVW